MCSLEKNTRITAKQVLLEPDSTRVPSRDIGIFSGEVVPTFPSDLYGFPPLVFTDKLQSDEVFEKDSPVGYVLDGSFRTIWISVSLDPFSGFHEE